MMLHVGVDEVIKSTYVGTVAVIVSGLVVSLKQLVSTRSSRNHGVEGDVNLKLIIKST